MVPEKETGTWGYIQQSHLLKCDVFQISVSFSKVLKAALQILWVYYFGKGRRHVQIKNIANILYSYKESEGDIPEYLEIRISKFTITLCVLQKWKIGFIPWKLWQKNYLFSNYYCIIFLVINNPKRYSKFHISQIFKIRSISSK